MSHRLAKHALIVLAPLLGSAEFGQPGSQKDDKAVVEKFRAFAKEEAASYSFRLEGSDRPLRFHPESVLYYTDPVVRGVYGDVFIWTADGRPEVVAAIYRFFTRDPHRGRRVRLAVARQADRRTGRRRRLVPRQAGRGAEADPRRPAPADSTAGRLRQMRGLAQSSPAARPIERGWTAPCACSPSPSIATRAPRAT